MARPMRTSRNGLELIKSFEGFRARAARLPNGRWIIGYSHTATARRGLTVSAGDAELILRHHDLLPVEHLIADRVLAPLSQNEFDALVSFVFNIGVKAFVASDVLAHLNTGDRLHAADAMTLWRKGKVDNELRVIDALVRRRAAEKALFLEHPSGRAAVATALVTPQLDLAAAVMPPRERPVVVETRLDGDLARAVEAETPEAPGTSPQAAARAVNERLTRILGENARLASGRTTQAANDTADNDGPSIAEITRAVSALADPNGTSAPSSVIDVAKGPPAGIERRRAPRAPGGAEFGTPLNFDDAARSAGRSALVDDLAPVSISQDEIDRTLAENDAFHDDTIYEVMREGWPFALLAGIGFIGFLTGIQRFFDAAHTLVERTSDIYIGPLLSLGSAVILVISAYYLMRVLARRT